MLLNDTLWYGKYGGCFIADAFTLACDDYYAQYRDTVQQPDFLAAYASLKKEYGGVSFEFGRVGGIDICVTGEPSFSVLGTALLAKKLHKEKALCGARYADEALLCAAVCTELGVRVKLFLSKDISLIPSLLQELKNLGAECETQNCQELFNLPEMYAFQEWVAAPENALLINCRSNVGAFPQTNIATDFGAEFGASLKEKLPCNTKRIIAPCVSGSYALQVFKAFETDDIVLETVECDETDDLVQELDSYCGTFTKVMRNRISDRVLAPELSAMFDAGRVERCNVDMATAAACQRALAAQGLCVSTQSAAAFAAAGKNPTEGTLCLLRRPRIGAVL